ncbi:MAG: hypothetical protein JSW27_08315 [Phycisphaerales bacterium]|nr:MAG: hypothetical protein JSW27_08315 [Phycisphaerales bacterium]
MARDNYGFQKRRRELAKKKKKEEKRLRKLAKANPQAAENTDEGVGEAAAADVPAESQAAPADVEGGPVETDH